MTLRRLALLLALALGLLACGGGGEAVDVDGAGEDVADTGDTAGGGDAPAGTLVAAISTSPDQLDPHATTAYASFQVLENVYDTLVVSDGETLEFEPSLATEWEVSEDNLTWTFTLRDDVTFHDGSAFDSADVVYSLNRIIDEELANAYRFANVEEITARDPQTVEIALSAPTPNLLANVGAFKGMAILPDGAADDLDLATEAVGTGPFTLDSLRADGVTLTAYEDYWGEGPFVEGVEFRFISEPTTALTEVQTGGVHWTDNIPPQQISQLEGDDALTLARTPSVDYWYLTMNYDAEPFGDPAVREAIALALNREAITQAARFDAATVNQTAIPEQSAWYYDYAPFEQDADRARELLAEAGAEDLTMGLMVTDEYSETVQAAQVIASQLGEVGVNVEIQVEDFATWLDRQGRGDYDALMLGWLGSIDPADFYDSQHTCEGSNNYQGYCNEETDDLLAQAGTETDQEARAELYDQAVTNIVDDVSYLYLYNPDVVQAWGPDVSGYEIRADRAINFETVQLGG